LATSPILTLQTGMQTNLEPFQIRSENFEPAYIKLFYSGKLYIRSRQTLRSLANCRVCPRDCEVNRVNSLFAKPEDKPGLLVTLFYYGEGDYLRGSNGSGTIFFSCVT
jgi:putative pyruvate formate lyase activating enzyme